MEQIILSDNLIKKLEDLTEILYIKEYFGYKSDSEKYINKIRMFIQTIPSQPLRLCKKSTYGKYFARYDNITSNMSYYITYDVNKDRYYVEDLISPKTKEYTAIIGLK